MATQLLLPAIPEMLGRRDADHGQWEVVGCAPQRGLPMTNIIDRKMVVPQEDSDASRTIRMHEMLHARVSPASDYKGWIERGIASPTALQVVEEMRVNFLVKKAGLDPKHLADGSELDSGIRMAKSGDWSSLVYTAVGYGGCGGGKDFLTGVRRIDRAVGDRLNTIVKRVTKELDKAFKKGTLGSTEIDPATGLSPLGFSHVERLGEWVDRMANPPKHEDDDQDDDQGGQDDTRAKTEKENAQVGNPDTAQPKKKAKKQNPEDNQKPAESKGRGGVASWSELKVATPPLVRHLPGGMGRVRRACDTGRNPRRMGRMITDPQRRIFDATKKGNGGVVIIDGSGSMRLTEQDIIKITEAAPGATVAVYSAKTNNLTENLWVLARDGKMVDAIPPRSGGNGVDGPAIRWGITQRKNKRTPVVFVTDGLVHGVNMGYDDQLAMDCIRTVMASNVYMAKDVKQATEVLGSLSAGRKPKRWYPNAWKETFRKLEGRALV